MKISKSQLKQIIKEEIGTVLDEGKEELQAIAQKVRQIPNDPEMQKAFKRKYARHANKATGREMDDPWGSGWVDNIMTGALEENLGEDMSPEAQQLYKQGQEFFGKLIEMGKNDHPEAGDILDALDEWASETSFEYVRIKSLY